MLGDSRVTATIAVSDINKAKDFYENTLGLKPVGDMPGGQAYESGGGHLFVYQSNTAGKNEATSANWEVSDLAAVVTELKGRGVQFEHYDLPGATVEGDVHVMGEEKAAWFKDPDGNILGLSQMA